jgi:hypothetical protein
MTAPNGAIKFNNSTGHDTQSSGLGPAVAVYGSGASTTAGSATVTGINTAGVSVGDLLWVQSSSGRQFSIIASINVNGTEVTCDDTFANTESGRTWAIGGKRATFDNADSRSLFEYYRQGWTVETETDQSLTSTLTWKQNWIGGSPASVLRGANGEIRTINQTVDSPHFGDNSGSNLSNVVARIENLKFTNSASVKTSASSVLYHWYNLTAHYLFTNCIFGDSTNPLYQFHLGGGAKLQGAIYNSVFDSTIGDAIPYASAPENFIIDSCLFKNCNSGVTQRSTSFSGSIPFLKNCIFDGITNSAIEVNSAPNQGSQAKIYGCIFYNCGAGFKTTSSPRPLIVHDCIFVNCTTAVSIGNNYMGNGFAEFRRNAYYNNTTTFVEQTGLDGTHYEEITLTADPFVDAANGDFNINNAAGGGAVLRSTSYTLGG